MATAQTGSYVDKKRILRYANPTPLVSGPALGAGVVAGGLSYALAPRLEASWTVWAVAIGLVVGVLAWVGLSSRHTTTERRRDRARILESLTAPPAPTPQEQAAHRAATLADPLGTLLAPQRALLGLQARREPLAHLQAWCRNLGEAPVMMLSGPSGTGKSRLAVELARSLPAGWVAGQCRSGLACAAWAPVIACPDPTLIVVDDADREAGIPELIRAATAQPARRRRVKVLLLVRDHATFTRWLSQRPDAPEADIPALTLTPIGRDGDRRRWFAHTVQAAAAAMGITPPTVSAIDTRPVGTDRDPILLTVARGVLAAHSGDPDRAAALRSAGVDELAHVVLEVEQDRWVRTAAARQRQGLLPALPAEVFVAAMLALVLTSPTSMAAATVTLRRLHVLREEPDELLGNIVAWAHDLYPTGAGSLVCPAPEFLHAALLAELARPNRSVLLAQLDPELAPDIAADPLGHRAGVVLARLARAVALFPTINTLIQRLLAASHPRGIAHLLEVLILAGPEARAVQPLPVAALDTHDLTTDEVTRLLSLVGNHDWPQLRVALQEGTVRDARRRAEKVSTDEARSALARALLALSVGRGTLGEHRRARKAAEEAVAHYRDLAAAAPAAHNPGLAASLHNLGAQLGAAGEDRRALACAEEAVTLCRALSAAAPGAHVPDLAQVLIGLADRLSAAGEDRRALACAEEAVTLYRDLAAAAPAGHTADLAASLHNLGAQLGAVGEHRRALIATEEAVTLYRDLAAAAPAAHTPDLAASLHNLGAQLYAVGEPRRAVAPAGEAVTLYRALSAIAPAVHTPALAAALNNLGALLGGIGELRLALTATDEAVTLYRDLAAPAPAAHTADLAASLHNLAIHLNAAQRGDDELRARAEAVAWRARLARLCPDDTDAHFTMELARADLASWLAIQGFDIAAERAAEEAAAGTLPPDPTLTSRFTPVETMPVER